MSVQVPARMGSIVNHIKRKHAADADEGSLLTKKQRVGDGPSPAPSVLTPAASPAQSASAPVFRPCEGIIGQLSPKYEVKTLSVQSSTSIAKHVDKALQHLSRFSAWDTTVLPGVVCLYSKSSAANKLITISETVRRRIAEGSQKWYQYNVLSEAEFEATPPVEDVSRVEDTMLIDGGGTGDDDGDDDDNDFETMPPSSALQRAANLPATKTKAFMTIFVSRLPIAELKPLCNIGVQTNEDQIEKLRKRNRGLA